MPRVRTGDIWTAYELSGHGEPLVFINGAWVCRRVWAPQVPVFRQSQRVLTYDLRGTGETGGSQLPHYSVNVYTADLKRLLDVLAWERVVLCGLSLGGFIAMSFAARHPERVRALVLAGTAASTGLTLSDAAQRYLAAVPKHVMLPLIRSMGVAKTVETVFRLAEWTDFKRWIGVHAAVRSNLQDCVSTPDLDEFVKTFLAAHRFDMRRLAPVAAPALVVNGEYEPELVQRCSLALSERLQRATFVTVPDADHIVNLANPAAFNRLVADFLATHTRQFAPQRAFDVPAAA